MLADPVRFDHFELQPHERRLLVDGRPAALGARAFDLLLVLAGRPGQLVTKAELLDAVWPGLVVEEANLSVQVSSLRKLLGGTLIATIPGRGYRFTGQVRRVGAEEAAPAAAPATAVAAPTQAPPHASIHGLVGRDTELAWVHASLVRPGCSVTLTGPAGVGKTRLASAAAATWPDGAVWVDLAPLTDPGQAAAALALALGVPLPAAHPAAALRKALGPRLLVLDNAEHLIDAVAALLAGLHGAGADLRVLATCQLPLGVADERVLRLDPLALPPPGAAADAPSPAVRLFCERARAADHRFDPARAPWPLVHAICRQLDGLPLALEMAAARVPALGLQGLHDALGRRFAVLTRGLRTAADRHRTLQAALDWSHALLGADEQRLFHRLGVCAGGFTLDLAVAVGADDGQERWDLIDTLASLVDRSLVATDAGEPPRYRLLETLRAYALDQLQRTGGLQAARQRHAEALAQLFDDAGDEAARARALAEHDNAREALAWARQGAPALAVRLACAVCKVATYASWRAEALQWLEACEPALADAAVTPAQRAAWWNERARQLLIGQRPEARAVAAQARDLCRSLGDAHGEFLALVALVRATPEAGPALVGLCQDLQALHDRHPAWQPRATRLLAGALAVACRVLGDAEGQLRHRRTELALARADGLKPAIDAAESNVINVLHALGRDDEALQACAQLLRRLAGEDSLNVAYARLTLLSIRIALRRTDDVRADAARDCALMWRFRVPLFAVNWALMLAQDDRHRAAARLAGLALRLHSDFEGQVPASTLTVLDQVAALGGGALPPAEREALVAEGRGLDAAAAAAWIARSAADA